MALDGNAPMDVFYDLLDRELLADRDEMSKFVSTFTALQNILSSFRIPDGDNQRLRSLLEEIFVASDGIDFMVRYQAFLLIINDIPSSVSVSVIKRWIRDILDNEPDDIHIHMLIKVCFSRSCATAIPIEWK